MTNLIDSFYLLVKNKSIVPRWTIFILDICICAFALFFAFLLRFNMDLAAVERQGYMLPILLITGLNIIFFKVFHTYEGIIRLSSAQEGLRCVSAIFFSSFVVLMSNGFSEMLDLKYLIPPSVVIIYFFTASFLIFDYRIWIKKLYHKSLKGKLAADNVLVYGRTINAAFLKDAIESISDGQYKVIGFIEEKASLRGKSIDNSKFYSFEQVKASAEKWNVKFLFMSANDIDVEMKRKVVDYCLEKNISVKVIPALEKWADGQLQTKQLQDLKVEDLLSRPGIKLASEHVQKYFSGKRVLITGAAGSIGSEIVRQLAAMDVELLILCDNRETALYDLEYQLQQIVRGENKIVASISDVREYEVMENIFETYRPHIVFHAAAYKHVPLMELHPCEAIKNNVFGTKIIADLSAAYGVERFVFISTDKAINPTNVMGASKRIAEMYVGEVQHFQHCRQKAMDGQFDEVVDSSLLGGNAKTKFIITRFGNVLGSNGSVIPRFQAQIDKGGPITVTHPDIIRYFMTIPEACSLVLEAGTMGRGGEIFVFDMGEPVRIVDLANRMIKLAGLTPGKDIHIEFTGLRPGEKLYEELMNKNEEVIPTHHKKIMISKVAVLDQDNIGRNVDRLIELAEKNNNLLVVKQMKLIVTEYKSQNSAYQKLDEVDVRELTSVSD